MSVETATPIQQELIDFTDYLKHLCGLSESTCTYRIRYAGEFLAKMFPEGPIVARDLRPKAVMKWVAQRGQQCKPGTASAIAGSVRRYFQFCQFRGLIGEQLVHAIPRFPRWRLREVPRYLGEEDLQRFLRCFDIHTEAGCRDYAMALCMVAMGLRASEVAGIKLQDIDWRQSILHIRETKCRRMRMLPLPKRPGRAIARYLRQARPRNKEASLFVRYSVPRGSALTPELVRGAMRRAYARAGFPPEWTGTHLLRHTAATRMHQRGATLKEVADVLGHRSIDTTAIYTKVNLPALRTVALPWPEVQP
jgi:site-specific recombinase XerD